MFRGSFEHAIDDKGRIAIPSQFRRLLGSDDEPGSVVVTNFDQCILAYPLATWEILEGKLASLPQFDPKVVAFQRYFIASATECPIDRAGRILVPANLRKFADIDKECYVVGNLAKFEIWSKSRWVKTFDSLADSLGVLAQSMGELGIHL